MARGDYPMSVGLGWCYPDPSPTWCLLCFSVQNCYFLSLFIYCFTFWLPLVACRILVPQPRDPRLLQWKGRFLTLDLQGRPLITIF